jgi:Tol biopolymer transport system component/DNA-binding winged helix-turn-helix (wHTH) protein
VSSDFRVAGWLVQPSLNRVSRGDEIVRLEPKVMQVLVCLCETPGEVVTRETLIARVWPDVFVTDDVLHRAIATLRRTFHDPAAIETIRKRGYRLVAPVTPAPSAPSALSAPLAPPRTWRFASVAAALTVICGAAIVMLSRAPVEPMEAHGRFVALTGGGFNEFDPAISADGRRVAFVRRESPDDTGQADLYISSQSGSTPERVTSTIEDERLPVWSSDGTQIAFLRATAANCDIVIRSLQSGSERRVMRCPNRQEPHFAWDTAGRRLVHALADRSATPLGSRIATTAIDPTTRFGANAAAQRVLTTPPPGVPGDHSPVISPDGRTVAFIRHTSGGNADIYIVPIEGGDARRLTFDEADLEGVAWSDNGRSIVYSSDRAGGYTLWRVPFEGGTPQLVAGGAARLKHPVASRDGRRIAYENWAYEINIAAASPNGIAPVTHTSDLWNYFPQVSPDGTRLAYVSTQSGSQEVWVANRDGSQPRQLTRFNASLRAPRWSPDGRRVALVVYRGAVSDVIVIEVESGRVESVTNDGHLKTTPAWSADGRYLYAGVRRDGRWDVWRLPNEKVIDAGYAVQPSPDGAWLYFTYADRAGLWRRAIAGSEPQRVIDEVAAADWANWIVTSRGLARIASNTAASAVVEHRDFDGTRPRELARLERLSWPGISVTPDGQVLYARWDRRQSRIMLFETTR